MTPTTLQPLHQSLCVRHEQERLRCQHQHGRCYMQTQLEFTQLYHPASKLDLALHCSENIPHKVHVPPSIIPVFELAGRLRSTPATCYPAADRWCTDLSKYSSYIYCLSVTKHAFLSVRRSVKPATRPPPSLHTYLSIPVSPPHFPSPAVSPCPPRRVHVTPQVPSGLCNLSVGHDAVLEVVTRAGGRVL